MSAGVRVSLEEARRVADGLVAALKLGCERIEVAGSIRRGAPDVGDIELVAVPRMVQEAEGLFETREVSVLDQLITSMRIEGRLALAEGEGVQSARGERYQKLRDVASGLQVDLFTVRPPAQWGVIFLIRTGPASFSQWLVTEAKRRDHHVAGGALHRGTWHTERCIEVPTPDESSVFDALGIPYIAPSVR